MRRSALHSAGRTRRIAAGIALAAGVAFGCSWDYPVWPKSRKSDTPLFRFVIKPFDGAGYVDREGRVVIRPTLDAFGNHGDDDFFDGIARVRLKGEHTYIDRNGKPLFRSSFPGGRFSEGLATTARDGKTGFIDREGKLVIPPSFDSAEEYSEGLAVVGIAERYGYVNRLGQFTVRPKYFFAHAFSEGAARVIDEAPCLYTGYGPCSGLQPAAVPFGGSLLLSFYWPPCRYSFIDRKGALLFEKRYVDARDFAEGLAPVGDGSSWGFIDKTGKLVIPMQFEYAGGFSEGLAPVRLGGKWGYVNRIGKILIPPEFEVALDFSEGLAVVGDGRFRYWFIDRTGRQAIPHIYTAASGFVMGRAHVLESVAYNSAKWSYIDRTGKAVFTYSHESDRAKSGR